jgi:hypothetical protein
MLINVVGYWGAYSRRFTVFAKTLLFNQSILLAIAYRKSYDQILTK